MGKLTHIRISKMIGGDGFISMGGGDVIDPEVFVKSLDKNPMVEPGSIVIDREKKTVTCVLHVDEAVAKAVKGLGLERCSMVVQEESFLATGLEQPFVQKKS